MPTSNGCNLVGLTIFGVHRGSFCKKINSSTFSKFSIDWLNSKRRSKMGWSLHFTKEEGVNNLIQYFRIHLHNLPCICIIYFVHAHVLDH